MWMRYFEIRGKISFGKLNQQCRLQRKAKLYFRVTIL